MDRRLVHRAAGQFQKAIDDYRTAMRISPNNRRSDNSLAWLLATCRDKQFLGGKKAVENTGKAVSLQKNSNTVATLAVALARDGRFKEAISMVEEASSLLKTKPNLDPEMQGLFAKDLALFKAGKPYTQP